jgi:hypothetical protein
VKLAEMTARFPFGLLLVKDDKSRERIPAWSSDEQQVTAAKSAMVVKVRHEVDGPATVRVWDDLPDGGDKVEVGKVVLRSPSGVLRVSSATGEHSMRVSAPGTDVHVKVLASAPSDPGEVDLIITPVSPKRIEVGQTSAA